MTALVVQYESTPVCVRPGLPWIVVIVSETIVPPCSPAGVAANKCEPTTFFFHRADGVLDAAHTT